MIEALDQSIKAVCPIDGVSIGRKDDKATWRIDFKDEATDQQRAAAQSVLDKFDLAAALAAPAVSTLSDGQLGALLVKQGVITQAAVDAAVASLTVVPPSAI